MQFFLSADTSARGSQDPNELATARVVVPPDFLAYQAMAHHRLGEPREALATLELLRKHYEVSSKLGQRRFRLPDNPGLSHRARVREAEALILGPPDWPEDVFAP